MKNFIILLVLICFISQSFSATFTTDTVKARTVSGLSFKDSTASTVLEVKPASVESVQNVVLKGAKNLQLNDSDNSNNIKIKAPATVTSDIILTMPDGVGSSGQALTTDGAGALSWATPLSALSGPADLKNIRINTSVAANALTISIKNKANNDPTALDPVELGMQASTGQYNNRLVTSALSLTISSGSTLGHRNAAGMYIWVYLVDSDGSGTMKLAVSTTQQDENLPATTVAEGGAGGADTNNVLYSDAAYSNRVIRLIGRILSNQATAGTWVTNPSEIVLNNYRIAEKEVIYIHYSSSAGQSMISGANTRINFDSMTKDDHNAVTTGANWAFVAPRSDEYEICALVSMPAYSMWSVSEFAELILNVGGNGRRMAIWAAQNASGAVTATLSGCISYTLNKNETFFLNYFHNGGSNAGLNVDSNYVWITIKSN